MGNVFHKRQKARPDKQSTELQFVHIFLKSDVNLNDELVHEKQDVDTRNNPAISPAESVKENTINNLELYFTDVYQKECVFQESQEEVKCIQTGIETLVQRIVDLVLEKCHMTIPVRFYKKLKKGFDVYSKFKIQYPTGIIVIKDKTAKSCIIKVGSFYEETKNSFPNEFDFIFLLCNLITERLDIFLDLPYDQHGIIQTVTTDHKESLKYLCFNDKLNVTRTLHFDKYVKKHGPASMLRFIYKNGSGGERYIHVDLSPAYRVNVTGNQTRWYEDYLQTDSSLNFKSLLAEVTLAKNFLIVNGRFSGTETEVHFMRDILSKKHVKVYRILKFLINGHGDGGILELYCDTTRSFTEGYSSYKIKTMMLLHHDECRNPDEETTGDCVLQILEEMCKYNNSDEFPRVIERSDHVIHVPVIFHICYDFPYGLVDNLKYLLKIFKSIKTLEDSYENKKMLTRVKSVSKQLLDSLDKNDPENARWFKYLDTLSGVDPCYESFQRF